MVCLCKLRQKNPILVFGLALFSFKGYDGFRKGLMSCFFRKKVWERWGGRCRCGEKNWGSEVPYIYYGIGPGRLRAFGLVGVGEERKNQSRECMNVECQKDRRHTASLLARFLFLPIVGLGLNKTPEKGTCNKKNNRHYYEH